MLNFAVCVLTAGLLWGCSGLQAADPRYLRFKADSQSSVTCNAAVAREQGMCEFGNSGGLGGRPGCREANADVERFC